MMNTKHTAAAKHFRGRLKAAGIKAFCRAYVSCGIQFISIAPTTFEAEFTDAEQETILIIAQATHLTLTRGYAIDEKQRTYSKCALFELPA